MAQVQPQVQSLTPEQVLDQWFVKVQLQTQGGLASASATLDMFNTLLNAYNSYKAVVEKISGENAVLKTRIKELEAKLDARTASK